MGTQAIIDILGDFHINWHRHTSGLRKLNLRIGVGVAGVTPI